MKTIQLSEIFINDISIIELLKLPDIEVEYEYYKKYDVHRIKFNQKAVLSIYIINTWYLNLYIKNNSNIDTMKIINIENPKDFLPIYNNLDAIVNYTIQEHDTFNSKVDNFVNEVIK